MKETRHIRKATPNDADDLKKCMESAYIGYQERMKGAPLPPMDADYSFEIKNYPTWVIESEKGLLGGLIMVFKDGRASIANIAINPKYQGQGIGRELMDFAESKAKEKNFFELHLTTHVLLEENLSLYQHLGWQELSRDENRVFMKKQLPFT